MVPTVLPNALVVVAWVVIAALGLISVFSFPHPFPTALPSRWTLSMRLWSTYHRVTANLALGMSGTSGTDP